MAKETVLGGFDFVEVKQEYWVPEQVGEQVSGVVVDFATIETVHGEADVVVLANYETHEEECRVVIGGGLNNIKDKLHDLVRITYEGEKENPNAKKGRSKVFKAFKLEVAKGFDFEQWNA